jgi:hypothetical protein
MGERVRTGKGADPVWLRELARQNSVSPVSPGDMSAQRSTSVSSSASAPLGTFPCARSRSELGAASTSKMSLRPRVVSHDRHLRPLGTRGAEASSRQDGRRLPSTDDEPALNSYCHPS